MGNFVNSEQLQGKDDYDINDPRSLLLTDERKSIRAIYNSIYVVPIQTTDDIKAKNIAFCIIKNKSDLFSGILFRWFLKHIVSYESFERFVINCTRISHQQSIATVLDIIHQDNFIENADVKQVFFHVILDLCYGNSTENNDIAISIIDFYRWLQKTKVLFDELDDSKKFIDFLNQYFPFTAKVIDSHFSETCIPTVLKSPSYRGFYPPHLNIISSIIDHKYFIPLALNNRNLQGSWLRLYCSDMDGMSFNRIEHHILGYDVSYYINAV